MSIVNFEHTIVPCVNNPITRWHVAHGWIWDVRDNRTGKYLGVFFASLLCGDGAVIHFDTCSPVSPAQILAAFRKGLAMIIPHCAVIYATVPAGKISLLRLLARFGFRIVPDGGFIADGREIILLKYFSSQSAIFL